MLEIKPVLASTIIFVVENPDGLRILLVKRSKNLNFAANHYAFPGGKIEPFEILEANNNILLAAKFAAIRETFEEIGISLFDSQGDFKALPNEIKKRKEISKNPNLFAQNLNKNKQYFDFKSIIPLSRWQPPDEFTPKFDTYFFIYKVNKEFECLIDNGELSEAIWINPQIAFEKYQDKTMEFVFPTIVTISLLAKFNKFQEIKDFIKWQVPSLIKGKVINENDKKYQIIDSKLGYPLYRMEFLS